MIHAPKFSPYQNGLAERSTRSLEIAVKNIITATKAKCPTQEISTQAVIAKNHVPRAAPGLSPALAMTGRCDILAGHGRIAFNRDPEKCDSLLRMNNSMSNILHARNAIITADATNAIKTMLSRKSPDRYMIHFFPGASVQIAMNHMWAGTFRVVCALGSNSILERASRLFKWPKCKTRLIHDMETERFDATVIPQDVEPTSHSSQSGGKVARNDPPEGSANDGKLDSSIPPLLVPFLPEHSASSHPMVGKPDVIQFAQP